MPKAKKKKFEETKIKYPNFDEFLDHPLAVEEESWYGGTKKYFINKKFKMVPIEDKENYQTDEKASKKLTRKKSVRFNDVIEEKTINSDETHNVPDSKEKKGITFSSPIIAKDDKQNKLSQLEICNATPIRKLKSNEMCGGRISIDSSKNSLESSKSPIKDVNLTGAPIIPSNSLKTSSLPPTDLQNPNNQTKNSFSLYRDKSNLNSDSGSLFSDKGSSLNSNKSDINNTTSSSVADGDKNIDIGQLINSLKQPVVELEKLELNEVLKHVTSEEKRQWILNAKRRSRYIKKQQGLNDSFWEMFQVESSKEVLLKLCEIPEIMPFARIFPQKQRVGIYKLGEGSFGEVFCIDSWLSNEDDKSNDKLAVKFIPVQGNIEYNGADQSSYDDILSEIIVAKQLSKLCIERSSQGIGFVQLVQVAVCKGRFPNYFQKEWEISNRVKPSENDNPKIFGSAQEWIVLIFKFAGCPLEDFQIETWRELLSIFMQISVALGSAEKIMEFEHRDLHWGNILILKHPPQDSSSSNPILFNNQCVLENSHSVTATIIDYTFSRIRRGDNLVYTDLSKDRELFCGDGDIQFEIYRMMKKHNENDWEVFNPKSNIFWLHYLCCKLEEKAGQIRTLSLDNLIQDEINARSTFSKIRTVISKFESAQDFLNHYLQHDL